jgi:hypothetical protein
MDASVCGQGRREKEEEKGWRGRRGKGTRVEAGEKGIAEGKHGRRAPHTSTMPAPPRILALTSPSGTHLDDVFDGEHPGLQLPAQTADDALSESVIEAKRVPDRKHLQKERGGKGK